MDKCRIFSQHLFGVDKGGNYQLFDTDEMMHIKKSKRKSSFGGLGWDMLKGRYLVHVKDDAEADNLLGSRTSSTLSLYSEVENIYSECYENATSMGYQRNRDSMPPNIPPRVPPKRMEKSAGCKQLQIVPQNLPENMRFKTEPIRPPKPTIYLGKTLEESAGTGVYLDGNGEYLVIGGKRYTAKFVFEENSKKAKKDAATQYDRMDFLAKGEEHFV